LVKIVDIFAGRLYSFVYGINDGELVDNELDRLLDLWTDVSYLHEFAKKNMVEDVKGFVKRRFEDAEKLQDLLYEIEREGKPLEHYFMPLENSEIGFKVLSKQKGKVSKWDGLRLYAIKIDNDCYVITGGAIKMCRMMEDHPETKKELVKIDRARDYLKENGVVDSDSFFEFNMEDNND